MKSNWLFFHFTLCLPVPVAEILFSYVPLQLLNRHSYEVCPACRMPVYVQGLPGAICVPSGTFAPAAFRHILSKFLPK